MNRPPTTRHNLPPQPTPFVGRARELKQLAHLLADPDIRLVTVLAPGGMGKTRLALEAARQQLDGFRDGVFFVPLAPVTSPDGIITTIAEQVGFSFYSTAAPRQQLLEYFRERHSLLVLDNCEHLLMDVSLLTDLLHAAPYIKLLATSREKFNLRAETIFSLGGMSFPPQKTPVDFLEYDAVRLFIQSARRIHPDFDLSPGDLRHVVDICHLTEGMPLGIMLAAGWLDALGLEHIAGEIQQGIDILETDLRDVPERQRSVRATLNYSWERLSDTERDTFMKLSVFRGGFTAEAAGFVAGAHRRLLRKLANKALIQVDASGRYAVHELLRQYAADQLDHSKKRDSGESTGDAHSKYFTDFLDQRVDNVKGRRQVAALSEIKTDFENVRTAWNWAVSYRHTDCIYRMTEGLWLFCTLCNRKVEGAALLQEAMQQFGTDRRLYGRLLARYAHGTAGSQSQLETALHIAQKFDDLTETAFCLLWLGYSAGLAGDFVRCKQLLEQSLANYRRLGDRYFVADVLFKLMTFDTDGSWDRHKNLGEESLRLRREIGDRIGTAWSINPVAHSHTRIGQFAEAERLWQERITIGYEVDNLELVAMGHAHLSYQIYFFQGDFDKAQASAKEAIQITSRISAFHHITAGAWSLVTLGLLASMTENYHEGNALCQQAVSGTVHRAVISFAAWGLSISACGLEDFETAEQHLPTALKYCTKLFGVVGILICLPVAALILAHQRKKVRTVEFLALAFTHPAHASGWMEKWPLLTRLRAELETQLGAEAYAAVWQRGATLDLENVCRELLVELQTSDPLAPSKNPDALTSRERDVLSLMARGHSNREIAEALVLSVGTVKGYVYNVCQKLGVQNRTRAAARARELNLL